MATTFSFIFPTTGSPFYVTYGYQNNQMQNLNNYSQFFTLPSTKKGDAYLGTGPGTYFTLSNGSPFGTQVTYGETFNIFVYINGTQTQVYVCKDKDGNYTLNTCSSDAVSSWFTLGGGTGFVMQGELCTLNTTIDGSTYVLSVVSNNTLQFVKSSSNSMKQEHSSKSSSSLSYILLGGILLFGAFLVYKNISKKKRKK